VEVVVAIIPLGAGRVELARTEVEAAFRARRGDDQDVILVDPNDASNRLVLGASYGPEAGVEVEIENRAKVTKFPASTSTDVQMLGAVSSPITLRGVWHGSHASGDVVGDIHAWMTTAMRSGKIYTLLWGDAWDYDVVITSYRPRLHSDRYIEYEITCDVTRSRDDAFARGVVAVRDASSEIGVAAAVLRARIAGSALGQSLRARFPLSLTPQSAVLGVQPLVNREALGRPPVFVPVIS
jgi:hypothetical protein